MISNIHKYISLKTTKKSGQEVKTPLWVIQLPQDQGAAIVYAFPNKHSGKINPDIETLGTSLYQPFLTMALCHIYEG